MSDRPNNGSGHNPWTPIRREPMKPAAPKESKEKPVPVVLNMVIPEQAMEVLAALVDAQKGISIALDDLGKRVDASRSASDEVLSAIVAANEQHAVLVEQVKRHADAVDVAIKRLDGCASAIEKAAAMPRKVTLQRDKEGFAVAAVSRPIKEGT